MKLKDLYDERPPERHPEIRVAGDRVFVTDAPGNTDEYLIGGDGELRRIRSDATGPLGQIRADIAKLKADIAAIKAKVGA